MSALENRTKTVVAPLLADLSVPLTSEDQETVAVWAVKTAMVFEFTSALKEPFYTGSERSALACSLALPPDTLVWVGRNRQTSHSFGEARRLFGEGPIARGYVTTFGIGRFVVQIFTARRPVNLNANVTVDAKRVPGATFLRQVWPRLRSVVRWPPISSFDEHGATLEDLSARFIP